VRAGPADGSTPRRLAVLVLVVVLVLWPVAGPLGGATAAPGAGSGPVPQQSTSTSTNTTQSAPDAAFSTFPIGGPVGEPVRVAAETGENVTTYEVDWGDGTTETIPTEGSHVYDSAGTYDVTLTVTDDAGRTDSVTRTLTVDSATDRRVIGVDESRPGTVDGDDPTTDRGRHYEPVRFRGSAGQLVAVATDTEAPVRLSVRRADTGTVVRSADAPTRHPAHPRVELPADGEYVVRVVAERDEALPVGYELAVSELAAEPGNESAPETADLGPGPIDSGVTVESEFGRDDRRDRFGSIAEATHVDARAGDRITVEYASANATPLVAVSGPGFSEFLDSGETLRLPRNGTHSVVVSGPNPRFTGADLPASYNLTVDLTRQSSADRLVVDADGEVGNYTSVEAATDAAAPGATVEVRPGTYREQVTIGTDLTLVAPDGATLAGGGSGTGVTVETGSSGATVVEGLTITGFETGVDTTGFGAGQQDWRLRNVTIVDNTEFGVRASSGDWRVADSTVARNGRIGVDALLTDGNRTITNTRIAGNDEGGVRGGSTNGTWTVTDSRVDGNGFGVEGLDSSADWTVRNVTVTDNGGDGILAQRSAGTWTVAESRVAGSGEDGIDALNATADWRVRDTRIANSSGDGVTAFNASGDWTLAESRVAGSGEAGLFALESTGAWTVTNTTVSDSGREGIDARRAAGDWTLADAVVENNAGDAVNARGAAGDWVVRDTVVVGSPGLTAAGSDGDWTVTRSTVDGAVRASDAGGDWTVRRAALTTVAPVRATGVWTVRDSNFRARRGAVDAREAAVEVDARGNWWGQASGPTDEQCLGNVDCGAPLSAPVSVDPNQRLVVDADGAAGNYTAIEPAVENASDTARVVVRPGVYRETVDVAKNVTVVAPDGATLRTPATGPGGFDIDAGSGAAPTIRGFTVRNASTAVDAVNTDGAWSVADLRAVDAREVVDATRSTGDWSVENAELRRDSRFRSPITAGVTARDATGDWRVRDSLFVSVGRGVGAADSTGDWLVENVTVRDAAFGVDAGEADGAWTVAGSRLDRTDGPVAAVDSGDDWLVRDTRVTDSGRLDASGSAGDWRLRNVTLDGTGGIDATETTGAWRVVNTTVADGPGPALSARDATDAWAVRRSTLAGHAVGLDATGAGEAWTVRNTSVRGHDGAGVVADRTTGDWRLRQVVVRENGATAPVVSAADAAGDWSVRRSTLADGRTGVVATGTSGDWEMHLSTVFRVETGVDATDASPTGDARRNYWGVGGGRCLGNVDCGNGLSAFPEVAFDNPDIPPELDQSRQSVALTVADGSTRVAGLDVYLLPAEATVQRVPDGRTVADTVRVDVRERLELVDGNEHHDPDRSPLARLPDQYENQTVTVAEVADRRATTAADGRIRFNGFTDADPGEYDAGACFLVVPPEESPLNVRSACLDPPYDADPASVRLDDDTGWGAVSGDEWPQFQRTPGNTGVADDPDVPRSDVRANWTFDTGSQILHSPVVANDTVYVSSGGDLYALDQTTGEPRWVFEGPAPTQVGPAATDGTVYYVGGTTLHAVDSTTGNVEWQTDLPAAVETTASVTVADGLVFVSSRALPFVAYDATTGEQVLSYGLAQGTVGSWGTPAYDDETGYVHVVGSSTDVSRGLGEGGVLGGVQIPLVTAGVTTGVIDTQQKERVTAYVLASSVEGGATVAGDRGYVSTTGGNVDVYAADGSDGGRGPEPSLVFNLSNSHTSLAVDGETAYLGTGERGADSEQFLSPQADAGLVAVDTSASEIEWRTTESNGIAITGTVVSSPAVANGTVFAGEADSAVTGDTGSGLKTGSVVAADADTGQFLWQYDTESAVQAAPAVDDGTVYVGDESGRVYALGGDPADPSATAVERLDTSDADQVAVTVPTGGDEVTISDAPLPDDVPQPPGEVVESVDIEAPDPGGATATVEFTFPRSAVERPESLSAYHYDADAGAWEALPTTVEFTDRRVVVTGETDEFSLFTVTAGGDGGGDGGDVAASESLSGALPARTGESLVVDGRAAFGGTDVVRAVEFETDVPGSVDAREFGSPPSSVATAVESDLGGDADVRRVVDLTPSRPEAEGVGATVELAVEGRSVDADDLVVLRETDDGWTRVETRVRARGDGTVTLAADVASLSALAVAEAPTATPSPPTSTPTPTPTATPDSTDPAPTGTSTPDPTEPRPTTSTDLPGFGPLVALLAVALFVGWRVTRRR